MFSTYLELEELIVLADSMMRRDRRLCRTTIDALSLYLDEAEARCEPTKRMAPIRICSAGITNAVAPYFWRARAQIPPWKHELVWFS